MSLPQLRILSVLRLPGSARTIGLCLLALIVAVTEVTPLLAQGRDPSRTGGNGGGLFEFLFRSRQPQVVRPPRQMQPRRRAAPRRARPPAQQQRKRPATSPFARPAPEKPATPAPVVVPVSHHVRVFGDSLADTLVGGLRTTLADRPDVAVTGLSNASSGLVRTDYYNWDKAVSDFLASGERIDAAVIMLGSNDRQAIRLGSATLEPRSEQWRAAYVRRIDALIAQFRAKRIPVFWVGMPPMRSDRLSADMVWLNEIFREQAGRAGATYVDIWSGFVDSDGSYAASGPDIDGQTTRLRLGDGVNLSNAGAVIAGHFLDSELRKVLGAVPLNPDESRPPASVDGPQPDTPPVASRTPSVVEKPEFGPIMRLKTIETSPGAVLLGGPEQPQPAATGQPQGSPVAADPSVDRLFKAGEPAPSKAGRIDDYAWPPPGGG